MNSKRTVLAAATAALLTAATVTAASAQTQERGNTRVNAGQNLSTGRQMNAQGPGVNAGQQSQGGNFSRNEGGNLGRNEFQGTTRNKSGMTSSRYSNKYTGRDRDRDRFASGRDRDRDRDRFAYSGRDRDRFANAGRYRDRDRYASGGWNGGWNNGWGGGGPSLDVSVGYGGWGSPGYYDTGYDYGYPGLYSYAPGYVGVGFGGGCTCGAPGGWR